MKLDGLSECGKRPSFAEEGACRCRFETVMGRRGRQHHIVGNTAGRKRSSSNALQAVLQQRKCRAAGQNVLSGIVPTSDTSLCQVLLDLVCS